MIFFCRSNVTPRSKILETNWFEEGAKELEEIIIKIPNNCNLRVIYFMSLLLCSSCNLIKILDPTHSFAMILVLIPKVKVESYHSSE